MEQGPGDVPPEAMSLRPFWSVVEILGVVAVIAPFVITVSSSSMSTVNGRVTEFVFRDWVAVGGGALGAICGLGAAMRFRTTMASQRALRAAVVIGLLGLGTFQILRGFGVTQPKPDSGPDRADPMDDPIVREAIANAQKHMPEAGSAKPPIDLAGPAQSVITLWQGNRAHELFPHMSPAFQKTTPEDDLAMLFVRLAAAVGKCTPPTAPLAYTLADKTWTAAGEIVCDRATLALKLDFAIENNAALLEGFHVDPSPPAKPAVADATKLVRMLLDDLLAQKIDRFADEFDPRLVKKLGDPAQIKAQLAKIAAETGKLGEIRQTKATVDDEFRHEYAYDVTGAKQHLDATFTAEFVLARWFVTDFNIAPVETKKP